MSAITARLLDVSLGRPAVSVRASLEREGDDGRWSGVGRGATNAEGFLSGFFPEGTEPEPGHYRLTLQSGVYFARLGVPAFFTEIHLQFELAAGGAPIHLPVLLSPFGYSTFREP